MSIMTRIKMLVGSAEASIPTVASATSITLPRSATAVFISGSSAIVSINADVPIEPGREITLIGAPGGSATLTNTAGTNTKGLIDLGTSGANIAADDVVKLIQIGNGAWRRVVATNN